MKCEDCNKKAMGEVITRRNGGVVAVPKCFEHYYAAVGPTQAELDYRHKVAEKHCLA